MQFASLIFTVLLVLPALSFAKTDTKLASKLKGDCNLDSSCGQPSFTTVNLNDSHTPIPGLADLSSGIKAAQNTKTAAVTSEAWVSPTGTEPLTIAPIPQPYSSEENESNSNSSSSEKAR